MSLRSSGAAARISRLVVSFAVLSPLAGTSGEANSPARESVNGIPFAACMHPPHESTIVGPGCWKDSFESHADRTTRVVAVTTAGHYGLSFYPAPFGCYLVTLQVVGHAPGNVTVCRETRRVEVLSAAPTDVTFRDGVGPYAWIVDVAVR